ncbi:MAG: CapA family protein [Candidatus Latescibacteria bacterium]|nr:CapA family protein [Candidatus Latescibacterota bacterium]
MKKTLLIIFFLPALLFSYFRYQVIENFDSGIVNLYSYPGQDMHPDAWALDSVNTYHNSPFSLKLYGNTWKMESINFRAVDTNEVWQVAAYIDELGEIQGFGLRDSYDNTLFYAFAGTEQLNVQEWVTVYQGAFAQDTWNTYQLPIGQDWLNWFGYLPTLTAIVFVNDRDTDTSAVVYFDEIIDITEDLPIAPQVLIWDSVGSVFTDQQGKQNLTVQFYSLVFDPDSEQHAYYWYFGDGATSNDSQPSHTYLVEDDHQYTVLLRVKDSTNLWGQATCQITPDSGISSFPIKINFVGDIMLARRYEAPGGIINTYGVESIFAPTLPYLGNNAHISVANLESPLTNRGVRHPTKPIVFRGRPENVAGLVYAGIDLVTLANNHILDYGLDGIEQTQRVLDSVNIIHSGAGANSYQAGMPVFINKSGVNIGFLAYSDRTGQYNNYQPYLGAGYNKPGFAELDTFTLAQHIADLSNHADLIVVQMHSGSEYSLAPIPLQDNDDEFYSAQALVPCTSDIRVRHSAIDHGADLVICHHPHIIHGFEIYQGKLISHSLGNFIFDLDYPETYPSVILNTNINHTGFYDFSVIPVYIDNYIPRRAQGQLGTYILDYLAERSKNLNTYLIVNPDSVIGQIILDTLSLTSTVNSHNASLSLQLKNNYYTSAPLQLHRTGNISAVTSIAPQRTWQVRLGRELKWLWFGNFEDEGSNNWLLNNTNEFYDTVAYQGQRSLCQIRPAASLPLITNLKKYIICYSDTSQYTLYGHIKTEQSDNTSIFLKCYASRTATNPLGTISLDTVSGTNNWSFHYKDFTPASGTKFFDIYLRSVAPLTASCRSWYDNVGIIEWSEWQPLDNFNNIQHPNDYYWIQIRTNQLTNSAILTYQETDYNYASAITETKNRKLEIKNFTVYPNPVKSLPVIKYNLLTPSKVALKIYNSLGQEVRTLINDIQMPGLHTTVWDGKDNQNQILPKGIYFCHLTTKEQNQTRKIILLNN